MLNPTTGCQRTTESGSRVPTHSGVAICCMCLVVIASARAAEDSTAVRARMAAIEAHLARGATGMDAFYVYRTAGLALDAPSLAPCLLEADGKLTLMAAARPTLSLGVDSIFHVDRTCTVDSLVVVTASGKYTANRITGTGFGDFAAEPDFLEAIVATPEDHQVHVRLFGANRDTKFSMTSQERRAWRDLSYYRSNFSFRTQRLPARRLDEPSESDRPRIIHFWKIEPKPRPVRQVEAQYPDQARKDGIEGFAVVEGLVDTTGLVRTASVLKSSGNLLEDRAAVRAALDWVFAPVTDHGKPRQSWTDMEFRFVLE